MCVSSLEFSGPSEGWVEEAVQRGRAGAPASRGRKRALVAGLWQPLFPRVWAWFSCPLRNVPLVKNVEASGRTWCLTRRREGQTPTRAGESPGVSPAGPGRASARVFRCHFSI